jgi:hypothetical protein
MPTITVAEPDSRLRARIVDCQPLVYSSASEDPTLDRPPHVRAASGLVRHADWLVFVQDDANFVAFRHMTTGLVDAVALPAGPGGRRRFETALGNKLDKLDLEAVVRVELEEGWRVVGIGSGSTPVRERLAIVDVEGRTARLFDAAELYARLRGERAFSGSELNVEGAAIVDGRLRLFQRGNGAVREGLEPVNATADLELDGLVAWLAGRGPLPPLTNVRRYDLGRERGVAFGFTDATALPDGRILFAAGAEDSPDTVEDGEVVGARIGMLERDGAVRWAALEDPDGQPSVAKVEGIEQSGTPGRLYAVTDADDPESPSLLCEIELTGPW